MICFTFHPMRTLYDLVDHKRYDVISVDEDKKLYLIERTAQAPQFFERVLIIRGADRLFSYYQQSHLKLFKIVLTDCPQNFFVHKLVFADAVPQATGIWRFREIPQALFAEWLKKMKPGLESESMALPWSYDD